MGIIVDNVPVIGTHRVCTDGSSSSGITDINSVDSSIYRIFSMQSDMKVLQTPTRTKTEFDLFLLYGEAKTSLTPYDSRFDQLDTYFGTIGISTEAC